MELTICQTHNLSQVSRNPRPRPNPQPPLTIIWASAAPVRLAVLKLHSEANAPTDAEVENAMKERPNYVIAVVGLPAPEGGSDPKALASSAFLALKGKPPAAATDSSYRKVGNSDVYFFRFPENVIANCHGRSASGVQNDHGQNRDEEKVRFERNAVPGSARAIVFPEFENAFHSVSRR